MLQYESTERYFRRLLSDPIPRLDIPKKDTKFKPGLVEKNTYAALT